VEVAGMQFYLDLHYSDTWADVRTQLAPAAWRYLAFPQLVKTMEKYTVEVVTAFKDAGVAPDIVQVGNEITNGLLGPVASFEHKGVAQDVVFDRLCDLLKAGIRGVHAALGESSPVKIVIHIDNGGKLAVTRWFFDNVTKRQVPFDVIALSYYPFWQGSLTQLEKPDLCGQDIWRTGSRGRDGVSVGQNEVLESEEAPQFSTNPAGAEAVFGGIDRHSKSRAAKSWTWRSLLVS
jgi:arabinogalactan endo-1,4-beta-galactosidase